MVNLDTLLKAKNLENDELADDDPAGLDTDEESYAMDSDIQPETKSREESLSREELVTEYRRLSSALSQKAAEVEALTRKLEQLGETAGGRQANLAEEEAFMRQFEESYRRDPVRSIMLLVSKAKNDSMQQMEAAMVRLVKDQKHFARAMEQFLGDPANAHLKPYREELEFLIDEANFPPGLAAAFVQSIAQRHDEATAKRAAAARAVRNRAAVESDGEVGEPAEQDRDFDKVLKKSRTLEDMFAGLGKLRL